MESASTVGERKEKRSQGLLMMTEAAGDGNIASQVYLGISYLEVSATRCWAAG